MRSPDACLLTLVTCFAGNVATEDCLYLLDGFGIQHGVDIGKLEEAGRFILDALGKDSSSRAGKAAAAKREQNI